jgi:hypothetical protein
MRQEFYRFLLAYFLVRELMHEAALSVVEDSNRLSFLHAVRVVRRKSSAWDAISPSGEKKPSPRHKRWDPRGAAAETRLGDAKTL